MHPTTLMNRTALWGVIVLLALAPVPLGSSRPFFWALNGVLVASLALIYAIFFWLHRTGFRVPLRTIWLPGLLFAVALIWMVIQIAPLPDFLVGRLGLDTVLNGETLPDVEVGRHLSVEPTSTVSMIVRFATYALLFIVVFETTLNARRAKVLIGAVFWIALVHSSLAILMLLRFGDSLLFLPKWAYQGVATGFFVNRNSFATFAAFGIAAGSVLALDAYLRQSAASRLRADMIPSFAVYGVGIAMLATAVVLSASRMGALVSALGAATAFVIALIRTSSSRGGIAVGALVLLVVAGLVVLFSGGTLTDRVGSLETNVDERLLLYRQVLDMAAARPWTGFGGGTFISAFPLFHRIPLSADLIWNAAHNLYLELYVDLGIFALAPILAVAFLVARSARATLNRQAEWVAPGATVSLSVIAAVHSLVDFSLQIEAIAMIFTSVIAAGTAQAWVASRPASKRAAVTEGDGGGLFHRQTVAAHDGP